MRLLNQEPCPECGCPGEKYDGHVCEDYVKPSLREAVVRELVALRSWAEEQDDPFGFAGQVAQWATQRLVDLEAHRG